ncbi:MAG: DinB family protein [Pyrinomonadaceae bacterium]|nr:DinB family protein [Pyrinomonadaceae bacterium]
MEIVAKVKTKLKLQDYRPGAIGSLLDEYERAVYDLKKVLEDVSDDAYVLVADAETKDEDCRSIETIMNHVVRAGKHYIRYIRESLSMEASPVESSKFAKDDIAVELDKVIAETEAVFLGRWDEINEKMTSVYINSGWGVRYNIDQMLEHAVVHILRHRRQIEKFKLILENN